MNTYFFESAVQETNPHFKQQNVHNINSPVILAVETAVLVSWVGPVNCTELYLKMQTLEPLEFLADCFCFARGKQKLALVKIRTSSYVAYGLNLEI